MIDWFSLCIVIYNMKSPQGGNKDWMNEWMFIFMNKNWWRVNEKILNIPLVSISIVFLWQIGYIIVRIHQNMTETETFTWDRLIFLMPDQNLKVRFQVIPIPIELSIFFMHKHDSHHVFVDIVKYIFQTDFFYLLVRVCYV